MRDPVTSASIKTLIADAQRFEKNRDFNSMAEILKPIWSDYATQPRIKGLSVSLKAEFLRLCGNFLVSYSRTKGRPDLQEPAKNLLSAADKYFNDLDDIVGQGRCACHLALSYYYEGRYGESLIVSSQAETLFSSDSADDVYLQIKISQLVALAQLKRFSECVSIIQNISERVETSENDFISILFFNHAGYVFSHSENHDIAVKMYTKAVEICEKANDDRSLSQSSNNLADALRREGQSKIALEHVCRAIALAIKLDDKGFLSIFEDTKANIVHNLGDLNAALHIINSTIDTLLKSGDIPTHCEALWTKIEIMISAGLEHRAVYIIGELCGLARRHLGEKIAESYSKQFLERLLTQPMIKRELPTVISQFSPKNERLINLYSKNYKLFFVPSQFSSILGRNKNLVVCTTEIKKNPLILFFEETGEYFLGNIEIETFYGDDFYTLRIADGTEKSFFLENSFIEGHVVAIAEYNEKELIFEYL